MYYVQVAAGLAALLLVVYVAVRPDVYTVQRGYDGVGMELNVNLDTAERVQAENVVPEPYAPVPDLGPRAGEIYQNVEVLGDLSIAGFGRLMNAITDWVVPADWAEKNGESQNCNYCHNPNNMASDEKYAKLVSRRMIQMTQSVNSEWQTHVGTTGVTCYTCHRGQAVPEYIWFEKPEGPNEKKIGLGTLAGQNIAGEEVGLASLPSDPYSPFLLEDHGIRVVGPTALPTTNRQSIKQAEWTYGLMMHMSNALGVNCTYCHNSRSMAMWNQSPPTRATAWYGIRMTRSLNQEYLTPLGPVYPDHRLGPTGDAPKANCYTCHQGAYKPLLGARMLDDYPSLRAPGKKEPVSMNIEPTPEADGPPSVGD